MAGVGCGFAAGGGDGIRGSAVAALPLQSVRRRRPTPPMPTPPRLPLQVGKAYATRASRALNKKDALALQEEGFERLAAVFSRGSYAGEAGAWGWREGGRRRSLHGGAGAPACAARHLLACHYPHPRHPRPPPYPTLQWTS